MRALTSWLTVPSACEVEIGSPCKQAPTKILPLWHFSLSSRYGGFNTSGIPVGRLFTSFIADGAYDQTGVSAAVAERCPKAVIIMPPQSAAVLSETAESAPTLRDRHLHSVAERGRAAWQKTSDCTKRAWAKAAIGRFKQIIRAGLRLRTDRRRATEVDVAVHALSRMLKCGRPISVRIA